MATRIKILLSRCDEAYIVMYDPYVVFPYATGSTVTSFEGKDWYSNINRRPQLYVEYE